MSGPIQNPNVDNIVQNPQSVNEHEQELTKVTEVAKDLANVILTRHQSLLGSANWQKAASNDLQMDLEEIQLLLDPSSPIVYRLLEALYKKAGLI